MADDSSPVVPKSRKGWRAWLRTHHASSPGVWLLFAKKRSGLPSPTYNDAVEEALCFGWIDGVRYAIDDTYFKQKFTPRKPRSAWAATNKARVARLIDDGLMMPAGRAAIDVAKANGSWTTFDSADAMTVPRELQAALNSNAAAKRNWPRFTESQRRTFLFYLSMAKRDETRAKRIAWIVQSAVERLTPQQAADAKRAATKTEQPRRARKRPATKGTKNTKDRTLPTPSRRASHGPGSARARRPRE